MIKLHISGNNFELSDKVVEYVNKKIGGLDKYLPKTMKDVQGTVTLTLDESGREDNQCVCEAEIQVPGPNLLAKEATLNMFAAIDIVEAKLKAQVVKVKDKTIKLSRRKIFLSKLLRRDLGA